jgi:3-deoxy-7-phosphoheptulonate synthase
MSLAAVVAGADGLIIEVHHNPAEALSDKDQALRPEEFSVLAQQVFNLRNYMESGSSLINAVSSKFQWELTEEPA